MPYPATPCSIPLTMVFSSLALLTVNLKSAKESPNFSGLWSLKKDVESGK